jgi:hypothetical protein
MKVDALAGRFDAALRDGELFRLAWERDGRPVVPNLSGCAYAVAMVHGMLGDDTRRQQWVQVAKDLHNDPELATGSVTGYAPVFDALVALHRGDTKAAEDRLIVDLDAPEVWGTFGHAQYWRTWYAAVWAESAALAGRDDAPARIERARHAVRDNPVAAAMVARAAAFAVGDRDAVANLTATFETLGCPYQKTRTGTLAGLLPATVK